MHACWELGKLGDLDVGTRWVGTSSYKLLCCSLNAWLNKARAYKPLQVIVGRKAAVGPRNFKGGGPQYCANVAMKVRLHGGIPSLCSA